MNDRTMRFLRRSRTAAYLLLEPFDFVWRKINRMGRYPPLRLRLHAGALGTLDGSGFEFVALLKLLAGLRPGQKIWDMGCGCGLLELALEASGWQGKVIGTDIHRPSIRWAARTLTAREPSFFFRHADVYSRDYWPGGKLTARQWLGEFQEKDFDLIVAKSFFTHVLPGELEVYLSALAERLEPGGKGFLTFFITDGPAGESELIRPPSLRFVRPGEERDYAVKIPGAPTAAVAYSEAYLRRKLQESRLLVNDIRWGWWRGSGNGLSFQDVVIVQTGARD